MKLTIIGSGTGLISSKRRGPAFLLELGKTKLLFDCGWGCSQGLLDNKIDPHLINHIFISHSHADHITDLMALIQSRLIASSYLPNKKKVTKLSLHGYAGLKNDFRKLRRMMVPEKLPDFKIRIYEYRQNRRSFPHFKVEGVEVRHTGYFPSVAFKIIHRSKTFVYSGDCTYNQNLINLANGANLLLVDASIPPKMFDQHGPYPTHLAPQQIGLIAHEAQTEKVVLFHLYDLASNQDTRAAVASNFRGKIIIPRDGQQIKI